jgi:hypothetical protein
MTNNSVQSVDDNADRHLDLELAARSHVRFSGTCDCALLPSRKKGKTPYAAQKFGITDVSFFCLGITEYIYRLLPEWKRDALFQSGYF